MEYIFEKFGFIVGFFVFCVLFQATLGEKMLNDMLLLILLSIIMFNADSFVNFVKGV